MAPKLSRWHCHRHLKPGDQALLTDVDMWPIDGAFWNRPPTHEVTCFYGDAFQYSKHTTLGFRASMEALEAIAPGTWQQRLDELWTLPEDHEYRHSDDASQSPLVLAWMQKNPGRYELIERGPSPPADRIDRSRWPETFDLTGMVDAHLPRDVSDRRVWNMILPLFDLLAPTWSGWARAYQSAWRRAIP